MSTDPLLTAAGLQRHAGGRLLWQGVGLTLSAGQRLMVTGPSGSGKSLLLRALAGLDPLEAGDVTFQDRRQADWAMPIYRAKVMLVQQRPAALIGSVGDALAAPFTLRVHARRRFEVAGAERITGQLGRSPEFLQQDAANLSGGEAQLVALTRALLLDPTVLLLDEATSALDPDTTRQTEAMVQSWVNAGQRALVMVSHDPAQRARLGTHSLDLLSGMTCVLDAPMLDVPVVPDSPARERS